MEMTRPRAILLENSLEMPPVLQFDVLSFVRAFETVVPRSVGTTQLLPPISRTSVNP